MYRLYKLGCMVDTNEGWLPQEDRKFLEAILSNLLHPLSE